LSKSEAKREWLAGECKSKKTNTKVDDFSSQLLDKDQKEEGQKKQGGIKN